MLTIFEPFAWCHNDLISIIVKPCSPPRKSTIGNDIMLALGHEVHILIAIFALVPVDNLEINSKFLHKRIAPRWFIRKYIENRIIYSIFYLFYSLAIIILITNTVIWKFQVITSADMYTNRIVPMHFVSCINIFITNKQTGILKMKIKSK